MKALETFVPLRKIEKVLNHGVASILLMGMMLMIVTDILCRYLFDKTLQGTIELTEFIMVALVYFTLANTQAQKAHIKAEILVDHLSAKKKILLKLLTYALGLFTFSFITWQGILSAVDSWTVREVTDGVIPFPTLPAKLAIPVGCSILCLRFLRDILESLQDLARKDAP